MPRREKLYSKNRKRKVYYFDIDGTITNETDGWEYDKRTPRLDIIERMKELVKKDVTIVLWTSRHSVDRDVTIKWLKTHDVPFHSLIMGKPYWDIYVCDKSFNVENW